ncbi:MAG TPA: helix-turn-helix domain-containing protein [Tepidisphaeraceae bacterium]|jgi:transcriptional regulator with XRE-family HTH domain|nr:helix-turn-helix domain-containing protein [Tepidisphaeraceae bacterium]
MAAAKGDLATVFGKRLLALRDAAGLTQEQLAKASGFDYKHIGSLERGDKTPSFEAIERIAGALKVHYCELFLPADLSIVAKGEQGLRILVRDLERHGSPALKRFLAQSLAAAVALAKSDPS